ncbi:MAG: ComEC/Rec2 family competence protein, partial [Oscillospiraceae bacterium]|nr:ComEC/Rec2 family competence protein [Oscillospiraceae bacterium]
MRKLMLFTIGFSAACAVGAYVVSGIWLLFLALGCTVGLGAMIWIDSLTVNRCKCILLGCLVGLLWFFGFDALYLQPVRGLDEEVVPLTIQLTGYSRPTDYGITADGKTEIDGKIYSVQVYVNSGHSMQPGDCISGDFRIRYTGGGAENPTYHKGKGVFLLCYPKKGNTITRLPQVAIEYTAAQLRVKILSLLDTLFPQDTAPFARALLLGDTSGLEYQTRSALKTSGVYHVVAVSGMHVSILFALVYLICLRRRFLTALVGLPVLILFAAVAGFSASIVRACIMQSLMIIALLLDKDYDPPTALAAAVLAILAFNPLGITDIGFQLSVGCMVGIFLFTQQIHTYMLTETRIGPAKGKTVKAKLTRWAVGSVSATLGAISLTTALSAMYFENVSIVGVFTNLLLLWLISLIFYGLIAVCLLGAIWMPLGTALAWLLSWPIRLILWGTDMISRLPVSAVYTSSVYIVMWLIFGYILLTVFLKSKKKHPMLFAGCLVAGLVVAVALSWIEPRRDNFRITAVDVGQGQCLILQNEGKYYMVDCGGDSDDKAADRAAGLLLSQGVFRLDGLILTHYDADHAGGVVGLLSRIPADTLYLPVLDGENDLRDAITEKYTDRIHMVEEDLHLEEA